MSQAITRHFVHFGNTHIDGGERKGRIVEIAGDVGFSGEHTHGEHQTARGHLIRHFMTPCHLGIHAL